MAEILNLPGIKSRYAIGLWWRHEDRAPKRQAMQALAADKGGWGVICTTSAGHVQAGFCAPIEEVRRASSVRPLAAVIANARPQPWMGIYDLGDGRHWYIAVRDGQEVMLDGDQVGSLDAIMAVRERHMTYGEWTEVRGTLADLAQVVRGASRPPALLDYRPQSPMPWIATTAGLALLLSVGGYGWYRHMQADEVHELAERATMRAKDTALRAEQDAKNRIPPWTKLPLVRQIVPTCEAAWRDQMLTQAGWMLAAWHCSVGEQGVTVESGWNRQGGLAAEAPGEVSADGEHAASSIDLASAWTQFDTDVADRSVAQQAVWTFVQRYGVKLNLQAPAMQMKGTPGVPDASQVTQPVWPSMPVEMTFVAAPWLAVDVGEWDAVPALRMSEITYDGTTQTWKAKGTLYANPAGNQSGVAGAESASRGAASGAAAAVGGSTVEGVASQAVRPAPHVTKAPSSHDINAEPVGPFPVKGAKAEQVGASGASMPLAASTPSPELMPHAPLGIIGQKGATG